MEVDGKVVRSGIPGETFPYKFSQPGLFRVTGTYRGSGGSATRKTILVKAFSAPLGNSICAWVGKPRLWSWPKPVEPEIVLEPDSRLRLPKATSTGGAIETFSLATDEAEPRWIAARLGQAGPILSTLQVDGFRLFSGLQTDFGVLEKYEDGTDLIQMGVVMSPALPDVAVELKLIVGGVVFEDGAVVKRWTGGELNSLGEAVVRFLRPAVSKTSVCHTVAAWQDTTFLGDIR